jgi:hypothetical protein
MQTYHPDPVGIPIPLAEFLLTDVSNRKDDRAGVWNDAKWQSIIKTFHAELQIKRMGEFGILSYT